MTQLADRVAVVTGASRGIGRAIALELAGQGAKVIVNYHLSAAAADEVVAQITAAGGTAMAIQADVSDLEQAANLMTASIDAYGQIDILVNNAGTTRDTLIMRMKEEEWDIVINTNLKSAWNCCKAVVRPMMKNRYGRIINITSVSGIAGNEGQTNYSASKAGLIGLTKALARELGSRSITVNAVAPGFVETDLTTGLPEELMAELHKRLVIKRLGSVEDMAYATAFLASERAGYITGHVLSVDGGLVMG